MFSFIKKVFGKRDVTDRKVQETPSWDSTVKAAEVASPVVAKPAPKAKAKTTPKTPKVVTKPEGKPVAKTAAKTTTAAKPKAAVITPAKTAQTKKKVQPKK